MSSVGESSTPTRVSFVGKPETVRQHMQSFIDRTQADELIVVSHIYDHEARLRSYEIAADIGQLTLEKP